MSAEPITEEFVHGFVKACFDAGLHEKQASVLLDAYIAATDGGMEKDAFWRGAAKLLGKGLAGAGAVGLAGGGALYGLNRLANDDSELGRFASDMVGHDFKNMTFGDNFNSDDIRKFRDGAVRPKPRLKAPTSNDPHMEPNVRVYNSFADEQKAHEDELAKAKHPNGMAPDDPAFSPGFTGLDADKFKEYAKHRATIAGYDSAKADLEKKMRGFTDPEDIQAVGDELKALNDKKVYAEQRARALEDENSSIMNQQLGVIKRDMDRNSERVNAIRSFRDNADSARKQLGDKSFLDSPVRWLQNKMYDWRRGSMDTDYDEALNRYRTLRDTYASLTRNSNLSRQNLSADEWTRLSK